MNDYAKEIINPGDRASAYARDVAFRSHGNCPALAVIPHRPQDFRGPVGIAWRPHVARALAETEWPSQSGDSPKWTMLHETENDGAGGKPQFCSLLGSPEAFRSHRWEIIAMTADDVARSGRFPAYVANQIDAKRVTNENFHLLQALLDGYGEALKEAQLVNITGETAIMQRSITSFLQGDTVNDLIFTWSGTCMGLSHRDRLIKGDTIRAGLDIIGIREHGYRCNGGSWFVKLIEKKWGADLHTLRANEKALAFVAKLVRPSVSYAKDIAGLVGWKPDASLSAPIGKIHGIAHITGGGIWGKLGDLLPENVGADLYAMSPPPDVLTEGQKLGEQIGQPILDLECYGTFHGGCGMILIVEPSDTNAVVNGLRSCGHAVDQIGTTTTSASSEILIRSQFLERFGQTISSRELK